MNVIVMTGNEEGVLIRANPIGHSMAEFLKVAITKDCDGNVRSATIMNKTPILIDANNLNFNYEVDIAMMADKRKQELKALKELYNNISNQIEEIENEL